MSNPNNDLKFLTLKLGVRKAMLSVPSRRLGRATLYNRFRNHWSQELFDAVLAEWTAEGVLTAVHDVPYRPEVEILVWHEEAIR